MMRCPITESAHLPGDPEVGHAVIVTPDHFACVPVDGRLVAAEAREIIVHRADPEASDLHLHFPRAGFDLKAA